MPVKTIFKNENCEWIDCQQPNAEDFSFLKEKFKINALLIEDMLETNHLPKYEEHSGIQFFLTRENTKEERSSINTMSDISTKLGIYIMGNSILTIHRIQNPSILDLEKEIQNKSNNFTKEYIALQLALKVLKSFDKESKEIMDIVDNLENEIFLSNKNNGNTLRKLYKLKRKSGLNYRLLNISNDWVINFKKLNISEVQFVDLQDKYKDVLNSFDHLNAQITQLISLYLALSDQKANQVMKILAMYSVYFLPITFIAGIYGMNFENMPELKTPWGYLTTLGVMLLIVLSTFLYFKLKNWKQ
jgi:magnesium transporter